MKRFLSLLGPVALLLLAPPGSAARAESSVDVSIDADRGIETCRDVRVRFDSREAERAEDSFTMPGSAAPLRVRLPENSGIRVIGGNGDGFAVTVCKAARHAGSLGEIHVSGVGSGVAFRGPSADDWLCS